MDQVINISWRTTSGVIIGGFEFEYYAAGRIVSSNHEIGGQSHPSQMSQSSQKTYANDDFDRLASDDDVSYTYDAAGNRMTRTEDGETTTYTLGVGDRLAAWNGGTYTYDVAGNVTRIERDGRPTLDLTWNSQYQLVSVSTNGVFAEGYAYDALCRRVSTTTQEGTTRHVYDNNWQVIADIDEQGDVVASYTWGDGIDNLLAVNVSGTTYYPLTDIQGTVWGYVDSQNNVVARWQYDAWGNVVEEEIAASALDLAAIRYRFQGREWSATTGLVNFRMRWYDPETGRWLSKDPIRLMGGINLYAFCDSDPLLFVDPIGLTEVDNDELTEFWFIGTIKPIIIKGDKVYPGYRFNYHPDPFGHGRLPDGSAKQPHVDQIPRRGSGKVRFDVNRNPLKGEKGVVPRKDLEAFQEAVKDVIKAIGSGVKATGSSLISVPILLCPWPVVCPTETEDGRLVS